MAVGVYPGSFDPPTVAHLAIAEAARRAGALERIDLVVSEVALGKPRGASASPAERVEVLRRASERRPWLGVRTTRAQLLVDIAAGYDLLVVGADKWAQLVDPAWYGSPAGRDEALARLPPVLVVPRPPAPLPPEEPPRLRHLAVDDAHAAVSSSGARAGRREWMIPEAADLARHSGPWRPLGAPDGGSP